MRTDLNSSFIAKLSQNGRHPFQVLVFSFPGGDVYLSDSERTFNGVVCEPIVESWGMVSDTVDISSYISNNTAASRQMSITLLNSGQTPFSTRFKATPPENITVTLYQGFDDLLDSKAEIFDTFVVQDPISWSEASLLLELDLVSKNMYSNPPVGTFGGSQTYGGLVVGVSSRVLGKPVGEHPEAILRYSMDIGTTEIHTESVITGFAPTGYIMVDFESIRYDSYSGSTFHNCNRGTNSGLHQSVPLNHESGAGIYQYGLIYKWEFASQPVHSIGNLYVDGRIYNRPSVHMYPNEDPVQIGFENGPPYQVRNGTLPIKFKNANWSWPIGCNINPNNNPTQGTWNECSTTESNVRRFLASGIGGVNNEERITITPDGNYAPGLERFTVVTSVDIHWKMKFFAGGRADRAIVVNLFTTTSSGLWLPAGGATPFARTGEYGETTHEFVIKGSSDFEHWGDLSGSKGVCIHAHLTNGPLYCISVGESYCNYFLVTLVTITKKYTKDIACTIQGNLPNNPADLILFVLGKIGIEASADPVSFETARQWYIDNNYTFDGYIQGSMNSRDLLLNILKQCRSRLVYNGGIIKLIVRKSISLSVVNQFVFPNDVQQKSLSIIRANVGSIYNSITAKYNTDVGEDYRSKHTAEDAESITLYGKRPLDLDFFLIVNSNMAADVVDFFLEELKDPHLFVKFRAYLGAFALERDDNIQLFTSFNQMQSGTGCQVAYSNRVFGSGKNHQVNLYEITAYTKDEFLGFLLTGDSTTVTADNTIITTDQG